MTGNAPGRIGFVDTPLPDGAAERVYTDGRRERRVPEAPDRVRWSDSVGNDGSDQDLGGGRIRREEAHGVVAEGQHVGNGVTVWNGGAYVTVNETDVPEPPLPPPPRPTGFTGLLFGLGLGSLFGLGAGAVAAYGIDPTGDEYPLYQEEYARQQAMQQAQHPLSTGADTFGGTDTSSTSSTDSFG